MVKALLVIDVQEGIFKLPAPLHDSENFLMRIKKLIIKARTSGVNIIYFQHCGAKGTPIEQGAENWQIHRSITPQLGEHIIEKSTANIFHQTNLDEYLKQNRINELIICGFSTPMCIDTAIKVASDKGYKCTLVGDAHATTATPILSAEQIIDHHNFFLRNFAAVIPEEEIDFLQSEKLQ